MSRSRVSVALGWLVAVCFVGTVVLMGFHTHAETVTPGRSDCGASALSVKRNGGPFTGGELRADEDAWIERCVAAADRRLALAPVTAMAGLVALVVRSVLVRRGHRKR